MPRSAFCILLLTTACSVVRADERNVDFRTQIRPILSDTCFACHGPDEQHREADLRLDIRSHVFAPRAGADLVVPQQPLQSELWRRISSEDPDERMPPADSGKQLTPAQRELIRAWIAQGAQWDEHWAFVAPRRPAFPQLEQFPAELQTWPRNPIDHFVLLRLLEAGQRPSPPASPEKLLRRLSLDLVGLPPTLAQLDEFLADSSPPAYERQVRRLMQSPHYGERWARRWLDAARYADSDGFEKDKPRRVWFYRDWVINALNRDLPYDQFIIQQIAGDLLPNATQDQIVATGFLRNSMINEEGGVDPEQFRMEAMFDRMDAVGKSILGLTIQCGQCHSHKYDPLTQSEYYGLFAFLNNSHESNIAVYTPEEQRTREHLFAQIAEIEHRLRQQRPDWKHELREWESHVRANQTRWSSLELTFNESTLGGQKYLPQPDGSYLCLSYAPTKHRPQMTSRVPAGRVTGIRLELLTDPNLPLRGPGRSLNGTGALSEIVVEMSADGDANQWAPVKLVSASADIELPETPLADMYSDRSDRQRTTGPITFAIDGKDETAWGIDNGPGRRNQPRNAVFVLQHPIESDQPVSLRVTLKQLHGGWNSDDNQNNNIGRFRLSVTDQPDPECDNVPPDVRSILAISPDQRSESQRRRLFSHWRTTVDDWAAENQQIERLWQQHPAGSAQLVLQERRQRRTTHLLQRGDFLQPQRSIEPGVPGFLHRLPESSEPDRLRFGRWLAARESPTTARAIVNRVWQAYFGTGLVSTPEDLGSQAAAPSHPLLLDWLAVEFMDHSWSLKHLHRLIVTSATYQQSSQVDADVYARDPQNRRLARASRFRVDGETVRDIALAVSGLLDERVGGPSVYPPAPEFLFQPPASYGPKVWNEQSDSNRYRRALYTFRYRSVPYPMLQVFDVPNGDSSCVRRSRSNTPLQSLTLLNEPLFLEAARGFGQRMLRAGGDEDSERLRFGFRLCTARDPEANEMRLLQQLLDRQRRRYAADVTQAALLLAISSGDESEPESSDSGLAERAAWTMVARVLLNLDETVTRE